MGARATRRARGWPTTRSIAPPPGSTRWRRSRPTRASSTGCASPRWSRSPGSPAGSPTTSCPPRRVAHVNYRYAPDRGADEAEAWLRELCEPHGTLAIEGNAPSAPVAIANPMAQRLIAVGDLAVAPKQAWTPVAEFAAAGVDAINFGPGDPAQAHAREEHVRVDALVRCYETIEAFACA